MFTLKPDYLQAQSRVNAFWNHDETDRPLLFLRYTKPDAKQFHSKTFASHKDRWLDVEYRTQEVVHRMENTVFAADSMPVFSPDIGPEILSAIAGCPFYYEETTTWTEPCIFDWETDAPKAIMDVKHPLFKTLERFTRLLLDAAKGKFIVGLSDFHPGADHVAALRDPQVLAMDLLDNPEEVKKKLTSSYLEYFPIFDHFLKLLKAEGMPISSWISLTSEESMYIPSNDFSYMISNEMFEEFFLEGIIQECRHYGHNIFHLDGPGCLRHLDNLLAIPELHAIQWMPGAGRMEVHQWMDLYKKILSAKKSLIVYPQNLSELLLIKEHLPARGLHIDMGHVNDEHEANNIIKIVEDWPVR